MPLRRFSRALPLLALLLAAPATAADPLLDGFRAPPQAARPRVWWHWMNGNVTKAGIALDLAWMKRVGIGGVQMFEGNLGTPTIVGKRLVWMSPDWRDALRFGADTAAQLGLDMTIAASPGWSASGAPWVRAEDAMKKLVWSETDLRGGHRAAAPLALPPDVAGLYQDVGLFGDEAAPRFYRDARVIAYRRPPGPALPAPRMTTATGPLTDAALGDGRYGPNLALGFADQHASAWILLDYGRAVTIRSATLGLPAPHGFGAPPAPVAEIEASDDGRAFRSIATLSATAAPVRSASFPPETARYFRVRLHPDRGPGFADGLAGAPGAIGMAFAPPPSSYSVSEIVLRGETRVNRAEEKAGFATVPDYYAVATQADRASPAVALADVIDLTTRMGADGTLDWTPPAGEWTVLRFGYSLTGHRNGPAPAEATGLEVDKLDRAAVAAYADRYLDDYAAAAGPGLLGTRGIGSLLSDSIESGPQNWTPAMIDEFTRRRGYDPTPWLPVLTGVVIGSVERSDRFLWDFRKTIADLLAENHYGALAAAAHVRGLTYYAEALEDHRPQLGDDMAMRAQADIPMGAMWTIPAGGQTRPTYVADLRGAASVAHAYGKRWSPPSPLRRSVRRSPSPRPISNPPPIWNSRSASIVSSSTPRPTSRWSMPAPA